MKNLYTINSRKFDNSIHRSWQGSLLKETEDYWLLMGAFEREIEHQILGVIRRGTISYEYYWKQKWFNVFRFYEPEGAFKFHYCNISMPPVRQKLKLDFVDLDIDIMVDKDFNCHILDLNEFEENAKLFKYPEHLKLQIKKSLSEILEIIIKREFPFDCKNL